MGCNIATTWCPRPLAAGALAAGVLCGCAALTSDADVDAPTLPQALVTVIPVRVGVHFSTAFRSAHAQTSLVVEDKPLVWQHRVGPAGVTVFRQALRSTFAEVDELPEMPSRAMDDRGLAAVLVPSAPVLRGDWYNNAGTWHYAQSIRYPMALHAPTGEVLAQWTVEGVASARGYAGTETSLRQQTLDQGLLRSVGAVLITSLYRQAALAALPPVVVAPSGLLAAPPAAPGRPGIAVLRLDAGLSDGDALERRVAHCVVAPFPAALRNAAFPWFEPGVLPQAPQETALLLARPLLQERLQQLGISHLLLFTAQPARQAIGDTPVPTPTGIFGPNVEQLSETVDASLWDVRSRRSIAVAQGTFVRTTRRLGDLLPIPVVSSNESQVCAHLRAAVRDALRTPP